MLGALRSTPAGPSTLEEFSDAEEDGGAAAADADDAVAEEEAVVRGAGWIGMKTTGQLRKERAIAVDDRKDSHYKVGAAAHARHPRSPD